jgi:hypothetical protein
MPTILRVGGHRFFFYSRETNEPPHIHVQTAEKAAKFWLNPVQLANSSGYNATELRRIRQIVIENETYFQEAWDDFFGT